MSQIHPIDRSQGVTYAELDCHWKEIAFELGVLYMQLILSHSLQTLVAYHALSHVVADLSEVQRTANANTQALRILHDQESHRDYVRHSLLARDLKRRAF